MPNTTAICKERSLPMRSPAYATAATTNEEIMLFVYSKRSIESNNTSPEKTPRSKTSNNIRSTPTRPKPTVSSTSAISDTSNTRRNMATECSVPKAFLPATYKMYKTTKEATVPISILNPNNECCGDIERVVESIKIPATKNNATFITDGTIYTFSRKRN